MENYRKIAQNYEKLVEFNIKNKLPKAIHRDYDINVATSLFYFYEKLLELLYNFDRDNVNCPGQYMHALCHLMLFVGEKPNECDGKNDFVDRIRHIFFVTIMHQVKKY